MPYAELSRARAVGIPTATIKGTANAGISWGTNSYPANSLPGWFAGPTTGVALDLDPNAIPLGEPNSADLAARMRNYTNAFAAIRLVRIVIYYSHFQQGNIVQYDGTAVANTIYSVGDIASSVPMPGLSINAEMLEENIQACSNNLANSYLANARSNPLLLTNTVCHTSCHTSCHSSRGRR